MRKLISILLIIACVITFGACAKKPDTEVTPNPGENQGGVNNQAQGENEPQATVDPGVDLEEDILSGDETTSSATPVPETSVTQETPSNDANNESVLPTATPVVEETPSVITLPFDAF